MESEENRSEKYLLNVCGTVETRQQRQLPEYSLSSNRIACFEHLSSQAHIQVDGLWNEIDNFYYYVVHIPKQTLPEDKILLFSVFNFFLSCSLALFLTYDSLMIEWKFERTWVIGGGDLKMFESLHVRFSVSNILKFRRNRSVLERWSSSINQIVNKRWLKLESPFHSNIQLFCLLTKTCLHQKWKYMFL